MKARAERARGRRSAWLALGVPGLGLAMLLGVLAWGAAAGRFPGYLLAMGGIAVAITLLGVVWQQGGSLRDTAASLVYTFFVFLSCIFAYLVVANRGASADLTAFRIHSLSPQTVAFLEELQSTVRVSAFAEVQDHGNLRPFFDLYERVSDRVQFEINDPTIDVGAARQFDDRVDPGDVFISVYDGGELSRRLRIRLRAGDWGRENILTNGLLQATSDTAGRIYFTIGKGERRVTVPEGGGDATRPPVARFAQLLADGIMPVHEVRLFDEDRVPADCELLVLAGPTNDLFDSEREMVLNYLDEGGALYLMLDPLFAADRAFPNMDTVLAHLGLRSPNEVLVDPRVRDNRRLDAALTVFDQHAIVTRSGAQEVWTRGARPVDPVPEDSPRNPEVMPFAGLPPGSWRQDAAETAVTMRIEPPAGGAAESPISVAAAVTYPTPDGARGPAARAVVIGDSDLASDPLIGATPDTARMLLQAANWLSRPEQRLDIPPKLLEPSSLVLTQARYWTVLGVLLLVGLVLLAGGTAATTWRRRSG